MSIKKTIQALKKHGHEEIRIHKEILRETTGDVRHLVRKHLVDTIKIHKAFWNDLKKALKTKKS